jgi:hypothetical protein
LLIKTAVCRLSVKFVRVRNQLAHGKTDVDETKRNK